MLLSKLSNRNTHVCTSSLNCSQVAMFQGWPVEWLIESSCSFIHLFLREFIFRWPTNTFFGFLNRNDLDLCWFSLSSISLSSSVLKWLRDAKLFRFLFSDVLSFAVFLVKRIFHFNYYRYYFYFDLACVKLLQFCDVLWRSVDGFVDCVVLWASLGEINGFSVLGIGMEIVGV